MNWRQQLFAVAAAGVVLFTSLLALGWVRSQDTQASASDIRGRLLPEIIQLEEMRSGILVALTAINEVILIRTTASLLEGTEDEDDEDEEEDEEAGELEEVEDGRMRVNEAYSAFLAHQPTEDAVKKIEAVKASFDVFWDAGQRILTITEIEIDIAEIDEAKEEFEDLEEDVVGLIDDLIVETIAENEKELDSTIASVQRMAIEFALTGFLGLLVLSGFVVFTVRLLRQQELNQIELKQQTEQTEVALMEAEAARNQALRLSEAKTNFLAMMSHEIRTPMNGVIGMIDLMKDTNLDRKQSQFLKIIQESAFALLSVINDVLDLTRMQTGRLDIVTDAVDVEELINSVVDLMRASIQQKRLETQVELDPALPREIMLDPIRMRQVLTNIVGNAVKFTDQGSIRVNAAVGDTSHIAGLALRIDVTDTGPGISFEEQTVIFDPFAQADSSLSRRHEGTGLGLSICKSLVDAMGGVILLESTPGKGSTFTIWLPLKPASHADSNSKSARGIEPNGQELSLVSSDEPEAEPSASALNILIVDDNAVNRTVAEQIVKSIGHSATIASNGPDAIAATRKALFDLILLDLQMPGMDGFEVMEAVRKEANGREAPLIVAMTAHASPDFVEDALKRGMDGYLSKPLTRQDVRICISGLLGDS